MTIETRLSGRLQAGLSVIPARRTDIQELRSGVEHRNARWSQPRRRFTIRGVKFPSDVRDEWLDLWHACDGPAHPFLLRDPSDYKAVSEDQGVAPSGSTPIPLQKTYSYGTGPTARSKVRPIYYVEAATLTVYQDTGSGPVAKAGTFADGEFTPTTAWTPGATITASFWFLVPVRFANDEPEWTVPFNGLAEINAEFIEVVGE